MANQPSSPGSNYAGTDDRGREQNADNGADRGTGPGTMLGRLLVLVHMDLAIGVLENHRGVVGTHQAGGVRLTQSLVVCVSRLRAGIDTGKHKERLVSHRGPPGIDLN